MNPPSGATIDYYVVALDEDPLAARRARASRPAAHGDRANTQPNQAATPQRDAGREDVVLVWDDAPAFTPPYSGLARDLLPRLPRRDHARPPHRADRPGGAHHVPRHRRRGRRATSTTSRRSTTNFSESDPLGPVAHPMRPSRGQAGFTLIELLVSMSLITFVVMATIRRSSRSTATSASTAFRTSPRTRRA